ncbi:hypothetical protein HPP92_028331 [Vanilla planifolia]|uniref:Pentatricopeptide repeat-containing protein n=1 Tax=Vanilla planifolia TaxID=51239 RepID=A0A835P8D4_VANPL|nr:hypothetical protein HPP92_028331 [Vanilla planifolia]
MRGKRLLPNLQCYEELLRALCSVGNYDAAIEVIKDFKDSGRQVSSFICNVFLLHTLKSQKLLKTWYQSDVMGDGNSIVDNQGNNSSVVMMLGYLIYELSGIMRMKENLENFDEVIEQHFPMDIYTYNLLLRASFKAGRMDCAYHLFCRMLYKGHEPNRWTYDTMVHGFCKLGYNKFADKWMEEMSRSGDLHACCCHWMWFSVSQAPSPKSNSNSSSPVTTMVRDIKGMLDLPSMTM